MAVFKIGESFIEDNIASEYFACDVARCKGACCTLSGGRGAPVRDDEVDELSKAIPYARKYLPEQHLKVMDTEGAIEGNPGAFTTVCIDQKDCVFIFYDNGIARCSIEQAYFKGEISWRKPLSCHLFPIRISENAPERLRDENIIECVTARENGRTKNIMLSDFLKDALIRKYGESWYDEFREECRRRNESG